jgi:hypothetical protein
MRTFAVILALTLSGPLPAAGAQQASGTQLDFLAGQWILADSAGGEIGRSVIAIQAAGAMLFEERRIGDAAPQALWFANSEANGGWTQLFVGAAGMIREFKPTSAQGSWPIVLGADVTLRDGSAARYRMTIQRQSEAESRRILEISRDSGASWQKVFDYNYRRVKS